MTSRQNLTTLLRHYNPTIVGWGNLAYITGGEFRASPANMYGSSVVEVFDTTLLRLLPPLTLSVIRRGNTAVAVNSLLFFAGGYVGSPASAATDLIEIYNITSGRWLSSKRLVSARYSVTGLALGNRALFIGGFNSSFPSSIVESYDTTSGWFLLLFAFFLSLRCVTHNFLLSFRRLDIHIFMAGSK
jgi:hypothetical protein